jgi:predicted metal-dependent hydrolase
MDYTLVRANRKTLALYVRENGFEVRAPLKMPQKNIDRFVEQKRAWAERRFAQLVIQNKQKAAFTVNYGSHIPYRGCEWCVLEQHDAAPNVTYGCGAFYLPSHLTPAQIKRGCVQIYRILAKRDLIEKVAYYASKMGVSPSGVKINGAKTRWGSCSSKQSLNFSWRLMMSEDEAIDYVVVHELAHIKEMNHSQRFWAIVAEVLPDYKKRQSQLKALQKRFCLEDWG